MSLLIPFKLPFNTAPGVDKRSSVCAWHSKDLVILNNRDDGGNPDTQVNIIRIAELALLSPTDTNQRGVFKSSPMRVCNIDHRPLLDLPLTMDITQVGNMGRGEGVPYRAKQGYLLWGQSNDIEGVEPEFRFTTGIGDGPIGAPEDFVYKAPLYWTFTDNGAANNGVNPRLAKIAKVDIWSAFMEGTQPLLHSGVSIGNDPVLGGTTDWVRIGAYYEGGDLHGFSSPTGGFNFELLIEYGTSGKRTKIGADRVTVDWDKTGRGVIERETLRLCGWAGTAFWIDTNDPAIKVYLKAFDDQF
jgi:hypothetical protein